MTMRLLYSLLITLVMMTGAFTQTGARYIFDGDAVLRAQGFANLPHQSQTVPFTQYVTRLHIMGGGAQPEDLLIFFSVQHTNAQVISQCDAWYKKIYAQQARPHTTEWPYMEITLSDPFSQILTTDTQGNPIVLLDANQVTCTGAMDLYPPGND